MAGRADAQARPAVCRGDEVRTGNPLISLARCGRLISGRKKILQRVGRQHYLGPAHVRHSIDADLRRLCREQIELYFIHDPPVGVEHMEHLFAVLDEARVAGKIGAYGVCTPDPQSIKAVVDANRCEAVQTAVDPLSTDRLRTALEAVTAPDRVKVVANHVLGRLRPHAATGGETDHAAALFDRRLDALSAERGVSRAHLLIRHAAALNKVRVVLTGTSNPAHLADNAAALALPVMQEDLLA